MAKGYFMSRNWFLSFCLVLILLGWQCSSGPSGPSTYSGKYGWDAFVAFSILLPVTFGFIEFFNPKKANQERCPGRTALNFYFSSLFILLVAHICGSIWGFRTRELVEVNIIFPNRYENVMNFWMFLRGFSFASAAIFSVIWPFRKYMHP